MHIWQYIRGYWYNAHMAIHQGRLVQCTYGNISGDTGTMHIWQYIRRYWYNAHMAIQQGIPVECTCTSMSSGLLPSSFLTKTLDPIFYFAHACYMIHQFYLNIWLRVTPQISSLCNFLHPPVTSSLFSMNILYSALFSKTHNLCATLNVTDQDSNPPPPPKKNQEDCQTYLF
jgi:hypothetical protein